MNSKPDVTTVVREAKSLFGWFVGIVGLALIVAGYCIDGGIIANPFLGWLAFAPLQFTLWLFPVGPVLPILLWPAIGLALSSDSKRRRYIGAAVLVIHCLCVMLMAMLDMIQWHHGSSLRTLWNNAPAVTMAYGATFIVFHLLAVHVARRRLSYR
jgi:hypothetical protein